MEIAENQVLKIIFVPVPEEKANIYTETCGKCCLYNDGDHLLSVMCPMFNGQLRCTAQARSDHKSGYYIASLQEV